jgi:hypothetical protein
MPAKPPPVYKPNNVAPILSKMGPPVYMPNPALPLQPKPMPGNGRPNLAPKAPGGATAPPVYKPASAALQGRTQPPPGYRPCKALQGKAAAPPVYRPSTLPVQRVPISPPQQGAAAPSNNVLQRAKGPFGPAGGDLPAEFSKYIASYLPDRDLLNFALSSKLAMASSHELLQDRDVRARRDVRKFEGYEERNELNTLFRRHFTESPLGPMKGKARGEPRHFVRPPRKKDDVNLTAMTRLSFSLFAWVKGYVKNEQEIQCMQIGEKLIITANLNESVDKIREMFEACKETVESNLSEMTGRNFQLTESYQSQASRKREELLDEQGSLEPIFQQISSTITVKATVDNCAEHISKPGPKIIFLTPGACHAEQNFLLILAQIPQIQSIAFDVATIAGKKRPCASCYRTLALFRKYWKNIGLIPRGGHYFETANFGLYRLIEIGLRQRRFTYAEVTRWLNDEIGLQASHTSLSRSNRSGKASEKGDSGFGSETEDEDGEPKISKKRKRRSED